MSPGSPARRKRSGLLFWRPRGWALAAARLDEGLGANGVRGTHVPDVATPWPDDNPVTPRVFSGGAEDQPTAGRLGLVDDGRIRQGWQNVIQTPRAHAIETPDLARAARSPHEIAVRAPGPLFGARREQVDLFRVEPDHELSPLHRDPVVPDEPLRVIAEGIVAGLDEPGRSRAAGRLRGPAAHALRLRGEPPGDGELRGRGRQAHDGRQGLGAAGAGESAWPRGFRVRWRGAWG